MSSGSSSWDYQQTSPLLNDTRVDRIFDVPTGQIDELPSLAIDIPDSQIIKNLDNRIQDSQAYWNMRDGYNLETTRGDNERLYQGKHLDVRSLYRFQIPYIENQIYVAEQAILAYTTASEPQPEVSPAQDTPRSKLFAQDLEKCMMAHSLEVHLQQLLETCVRNALNKRIGIIFFEFDEEYGSNGEIIPRALNPEDVIIDKNAPLGTNPAFICRKLKMSVNEACRRWPEKQEEIYRNNNITRGTYKQLETIIVINEVWLTHYDKSFQPQEAVVYYLGDCVLEKDKSPHWLYATKKNFLKAPKKPFIPLNFDNDGRHWIDNTSSVEQAGRLQFVLNKRGRQYMEVVDKANGTLVIDSRSGITKADSQDLTGDPNQHIVIAGLPNVNNQELIFRLPPPEIPTDLMNDKIDLRTNIHSIMGTPSEFTGVNDGNADPETLGEALMKKNQASGRQDLYVRSIDRFMNDYFNFLVQMMVVWYNEKHFFVYNGGDGEFDYITMSRDLIEDGMAVNVRSGTTLPFDKQRQEAVVLQLMKNGGAISLLDAYKFLHLPNPQQLYDNWAKSQADPMALARDALDELDESKAYIAYIEIMNGKKPKDPDDCNKEFVLSLRKLMLRDEFLKAPRKYQKAFLDYVDKALSSLELRTELDLASREGIQALEPQQPLPPLPPLQPPMAPGMMPPGAPMPGQVTAPMGQPPGAPPQAPLGQMAQPPSPTPGSITNGLPLPNPANPQVPSPANPGALPTI